MPARTKPRPGHRGLALIVASALFMEQLDGTILATALPRMADTFGVAPQDMSVALTSYLVSLAVFIPVSGWIADSFGSRSVFCYAIGLFTVGSVLCGLSTGVVTLVLARILQGIGGAMMVPTGRLVLLRAVAKADMVSAMTWLMVPALIGPLLGPPVGGFTVTYLSWRWIFYINVPIGLLGIALALRFIENVRLPRVARLDTRGFLLSGASLAFLIFGFEMMARHEVSAVQVAAVLATGSLCGWLYVRHARGHPAPVLDLRLLTTRTFQVSVLAGGLSRIAVGALPFLLPMMLQLGFGWSAATSGSITFATSAGSITIRLLARPILRRWGFRRIMVWNGALAAVLIGCTAAIQPSWPLTGIVGLLFVVGLFEALQFIAYNTIAYADIPADRMSAATSFYATFQQLNLTVGICIAGWALNGSMALFGRSEALITDYAIALVSVAALSVLASPVCALLATDAGDQLSGHASDH
jgi:EmrB/QacA subfamily drug resistance transporter